MRVARRVAAAGSPFLDHPGISGADTFQQTCTQRRRRRPLAPGTRSRCAPWEAGVRLATWRCGLVVMATDNQRRQHATCTRPRRRGAAPAGTPIGTSRQADRRRGYDGRCRPGCGAEQISDGVGVFALMNHPVAISLTVLEVARRSLASEHASIEPPANRYARIMETTNQTKPTTAATSKQTKNICIASGYSV